jgi:hypothetical protein
MPKDDNFLFMLEKKANNCEGSIDKFFAKYLPYWSIIQDYKKYTNQYQTYPQKEASPITLNYVKLGENKQKEIIDRWQIIAINYILNSPYSLFICNGYLNYLDQEMQLITVEFKSYFENIQRKFKLIYNYTNYFKYLVERDYPDYTLEFNYSIDRYDDYSILSFDNAVKLQFEVKFLGGENINQIIKNKIIRLILESYRPKTQFLNDKNYTGLYLISKEPYQVKLKLYDSMI